MKGFLSISSLSGMRKAILDNFVIGGGKSNYAFVLSKICSLTSSVTDNTFIHNVTAASKHGRGFLACPSSSTFASSASVANYARPYSNCSIFSILNNQKQIIMNKKLLKMMLVAVGMVAGTVFYCPMSANAQNKRILNSQDYEAATTTDWTSPNGKSTLATNDETYGNYAKLEVSGSGNRSAYKSVTFDKELNGYTDPTMTENGYVIEFDMRIQSGNVNNRSLSQFIVPTEGPNLATNTTYSGTKYVFSLSQPTRNANSISTTWYINDLTNSSENTVTLSNSKWYHYIFVVTSKTTTYTIKDGETELKSGSLNITTEELPIIKGFFTLLGRGYGFTYFDNLSIYDYVKEVIANVPTITLTKVNGKARTYTITYTDGETLHYMLPGETEYTEVSTGNSIEVTTSESGELVAYTTNGESQSANVTETVDASEIALNVPTSALTNLGEGYEKEYTISIDNSNILLTPTASLCYVFTSEDGKTSDAVNISNGGKINMSEAGTYVITASAEGYTSSSITIKNDVAYTATNEFDFAGMTADDFADTNIWQQGEDPNNKWGWSTSNPCTKFELQNISENANIAINGISLFTNRIPTFYIGKGLMAPYDLIEGPNSNYGPIKLQNTQKGQMAVYTYLNNYGKNTLVTVQSADAVYNLYRYSDMLANIKVYSPTDMLTAKIGNAMYATYVTVSKTTVPASVKAYTVKANAEKTGIELSEIAAGTVIPANTALLLHAAEGTYDFTVSTEDAATIENNALVPATTDVTATGNEYALTKQDGKVGFAQVEAGVVIPAGKAYLVVDNSDESAAKFFSFDNGEVTGINNVNTVDADNNAYYTLQGLKTQKPVKGMYIHNGKKVILK